MNRTQFDFVKKNSIFVCGKFLLAAKSICFFFIVEFNPEKFFSVKMNIYIGLAVKNRSQSTVNSRLAHHILMPIEIM